MLHIDIDTTEGSEFLQDMIKKYLEGLQWIMYYYFQGVKNWHWHYPHHYAPMISDFYDIHRLLDLEDSKLIFPPAEPFKPLEQLMGVIPPRSQDMLPEEYKILLREADLQRYFPDVPLIEYDIMCAKIGWESLKIIVPFVPYDLLIERARTLTESKQSEIQNATNKDVLYVYDTREAVRSIQSTIPGLFPDVDSTIREIELDYDEDAVFKPEILPGTADVLPGFPSLSHLKNNPELRAVGINVFQTASQLPSVMLNFDRSPMTIEEAYNSLYRKVVYVNYPLQELGIVIGVSNHEKYFPSIDQNYLDYIGLTADGYLTMVRAKLNDYMSLKQGFSIQPEMGIVVHYLPLKSFTRSSRGHIEPKWENDEAYTPLELIMKERAKGHPRDITSVAPSLEEEFPMHAKVIILRKELFGCIGEIVGYAPDKFNPEGGLRVQVFQKPKNICDEIKKVSNLHYEKYYTLKELAGALKRPLGLIARMLGNLKILAKKKGKTKILQIGLNLKNDKEYMAALGWSRWGGYWNPGSDEWEFSEESKKVLMQYNNTFPSMWSSIEKCWAQGKRKFYLDDVFGYARDPFKESEKVALWIFKHVSFKIPWTSVYSQYLSDPVVENLRMIAKNAPFEPITEVFNTNPGFLFIETKPWTGPYLLKPQDYQLGDRVMNLCSGYHRYVNLGAEGTIISLIDRGHAEVLFDELVLNDPKSYKLIISTRYLLNVTRRIIAGKRDQTDVSSCDDIIQHDDSSFKPLLGKKPIKENRAEEITSQILAKMTKNSPSTNDQTAANLALSLNPMANTFDPVPREAQKSPNFESSEREVHISPDQLFAIYQTAPLSGEINPSVAQFFENSQTNVQSNWVQSQESNPNPKPYGIPIPVEQLFESLQISEVKEQESESVHQSLESAQKETESRESGPEVISKLFQGVGPGQYEAPSGLDFPHP